MIVDLPNLHGHCNRKGNGAISAAGGTGWGGGGGGRISLDCYSIQEDVKITSHGVCKVCW